MAGILASHVKPAQAGLSVDTFITAATFMALLLVDRLRAWWYEHLTRFLC